jgi:hypothetical protein
VDDAVATMEPAVMLTMRRLSVLSCEVQMTANMSFVSGVPELPLGS